MAFESEDGLIVMVPHALIIGDSGRARGMASFAFFRLAGPEGRLRRLLTWVVSAAFVGVDTTTSGLEFWGGSR